MGGNPIGIGYGACTCVRSSMMSVSLTNRDYTVPALTELLVREGWLTDRQQADIVRNERAIRERLLRKRATEAASRQTAVYEVSPVEVLAASGITAVDGRALSEDRLTEFLARLAGLPYIKLDPLKLDERLITDTMSRAFARRHVCLPVERNPRGVVVFAVDNPFDLPLQESLRSITPAGFEFVLASRSDILRIITDVYGFRSAVKAAQRSMSPGTDLGNLEQLVKLTNVDELESNDKHVVKAVEYLLHYAFEQRASDIHMEPKREECIIRLRIDGVLHNVYRMPRAVHNAVVSRIKTLCRMDIAERRRPQDGRFKTELRGRETEMRVSSLPVAFGEKLVIRIFDPSHLLQEIEGLGFVESELTLWREFIGRPNGLILITGPTGSGKTTTLYSTLKMLASPETNITTIEDPVEMVYEAFNQVLVNTKIGVTFASALRTALRQDPDILMVGEIRDQDTAEMALQAALTGHLVFSTLHTNDAPTAITRLQDLGAPSYLISSTLVGVLAQRLVRRICDNCKTQTSLSEEQVAILGIQLPPGSPEQLPVYYGEGCAHCRGTGYFGRVGIYEIMTCDTGIRRLIGSGADADQIRREAVANGMVRLREAAIRKLATGLTSFEEVVRVLGESAP
jgi:general secretion pathway protein E